MDKENKKNIFESELSIRGVTLVDKALFAKHLSVMLKSGMTLNDAILVSAESVKGKFKNILRDIYKSIQSGRSLSSAFSDHPKVFSGLFINAIYAGEASGTLVENLENVSEQLQKDSELRSKIKGAMVYPMVVLFAAFVLSLILSFVILPKIIPLFEGLKVNLPFTTKAIIWFANFIKDYGWQFLVSIFAIFIFISWLIRQKFVKPFTHWILLHTPVIRRISYNSNLARFSRVMATLLRSGVSIDQAINITKNTMDNYYYRTALEDVKRSIEKGGKLSENLARFGDLFPQIATQMIRVGEQAGKFEDTLFYLSDFYESEVDSATKALSAAIEPMLLLLIGLVVGFLALSIITPIYNITGNIQR